MGGQVEASENGGKDVHISLHFNSRVWEALKKVGRDIAVSAGFNVAALATNFSVIPEFASREPSSQALGLYGAGIVITAVGIAAGRYIGGAFGSAADMAAHHREDGKYRKTLATIGGTIGGVSTFALYHSGIWAMGD